MQTPIFIILYRVLAGLTQFQPYGHDMGTAAGLLYRDPSSGGEFVNFGTFDPSYLKHSTALYQDLSVSRTMNFVGLDLANSCMESLREGVVSALPYLVLVAIVAVSAPVPAVAMIIAFPAETPVMVPALTDATAAFEELHVTGTSFRRPV